ncbi:MAG: heme lyase CcmF/NrfE family subunit [Aeromonas sp.]
MLAEGGFIWLVVATLSASLQGVLPWAALSPTLAARMGPIAPRLLWAVRPLAQLTALGLGLSLLCLGLSFAQNDFSVRYVAAHANIALPLGYKLAAVWGGHEGSMLFMVFALSLWSALLALPWQRLDALTRTRVLAVLGLIIAALALYTLYFSNPFTRQFPPPLDGRDLNPMLQDIGLIVHPPLLYFGYVGFAVNFAFAMAALHSGRMDGAIAHWSRPWALAAWLFLTAGIALGAGWAYYELGWGGWWFWDPVENASLLPWLLGTALLHALIVCERRGAFGHGVLLLSIFTFALSLLGTFVVRSGVLTSVHAFAVDPARGLSLLLILGTLLTLALTLFAVRADLRAPFAQFGLRSKEGGIGAAVAILCAACASVLLGTFYPLLAKLLGAGALSVGAPYFNSVFVPLSLLALWLMSLAPRLRWQQLAPASRLARWLPWLLGALLAVGVCQHYGAFSAPIAQWPWLALASNSLAFGAIGQLMWPYLRARRWPRRAQAASLLAHVGVAVCVLGVTQLSYFSLERGAKLTPGMTQTVGDYRFVYQGRAARLGANFTSEQLTIAVERDGEEVAQLQPERRHYSARGMTMLEPGIAGGVWGDLYAVLGERLGPEHYSVRLYVKPWVRWIWAGGLLMLLGALLGLLAPRLTMPPASAEKSL